MSAAAQALLLALAAMGCAVFDACFSRSKLAAGWREVSPIPRYFYEAWGAPALTIWLLGSSAIVVLVLLAFHLLLLLALYTGMKVQLLAMQLAPRYA